MMCNMVVEWTDIGVGDLQHNSRYVAIKIIITEFFIYFSAFTDRTVYATLILRISISVLIFTQCLLQVIDRRRLGYTVM